MRVAIIEDDAVHAEIASVVLQQADFDVEVYTSAGEFRRHAKVADFELLLIDWMLPGESGLEFLQQIRGAGDAQVPVIFLTAVEEDARVVEALARGADDYIVKPAKPALLVARVRALLRRSKGSACGAATDFPPFGFDLESRRIAIDSAPIHLTPREFEMALYLFQRAGRIVSREALLSQVWGVGRSVDTRSVDTYAYRLRKTLGLDGSSGWKLEGIYQVGYRLSKHEASTPAEG